MKRTTKVVWIATVFLTLVIAAVVGVIVYFTAFKNKDEARPDPPAVGGGEPNSEVNEPSNGTATSSPGASLSPSPPASPSLKPTIPSSNSTTTTIPPTTTTTTTTTTATATSTATTTIPPVTTQVFDHLSHAVPGESYDVVDFDGDGVELVQLDGSRSHTHYTESDPIVQGRLVYMNWFDNATKTSLASTAKPQVTFPIGSTTVGLTVRDNSGDSHTAYTRVVVRRPIQSGVYCYYYASDENEELTLNNDRTSGGQATFAHQEKADIAFVDAKSFPERVRGSAFQMRCTFVVRPLPVSSVISFSVTHVGEVRLVVNDDDIVLQSSQKEEKTTTGDISLTSEKYHSVQLLYAAPATSPKVVLDVEGSDSASTLQYDSSHIIPVIGSIEPLTSTLEGGGYAKLVGIGLENNVRVDFGGVDLTIDADKSNDNSVFVQVPSSDTARRVEVRLFNNAGHSNAVAFEYQPDGKPPIIFRESNMTMQDGSDLNIQLITGIRYGPDHRYYLSAIHSIVYSLETDSSMKVLDTVCRSSSLGLNRAILGLAFNPGDAPDDFNLYVSGSVLEWKDKERLSGPRAWMNGQVILVRKDVNGACLGKVRDVITGLPVTNHDHGVNAMVFDQDGRLHFQVGGFTNAGVLDETRLGGLAANPLSGASLVADVTNPAFDGDIKYSTDNPAEAVQTSGDVFVYMAGFRNSFGITLHSNGQLYCTDNGASVSFGPKSTSCTAHAELYGENLHDELMRLVEGKYAGHPNRNRGRTDARQCIFKGPDEPSDGFYTAPMTTFESSTNGIMEYTARTFDAQLKGDLILTKFATQDSDGKVFRVRLNGDGKKVMSGPDELYSKSGLSVEMSPYGDILTPRVFGKRIILLAAKRTFNRLVPTFTAVAPFRGPRAGGNWVLVTGEDFTKGAVAVFGGRPCTEPSVVAKDGRSFRCKVPPAANGVAAVRVALRFDDERRNVAAEAEGVDYLYARK